LNGNRKLKANSSNRTDILEDPEIFFLKVPKHAIESFERRKFKMDLLKALKHFKETRVVLY
jgi:hypothetical protein